MLASRSVIDGGIFVARPCSHLGIRCKHRQSERARIVKYPVPALNQFSARIEEKRCGEWDEIVKKFNSFISQIWVARSPNHLYHTLPGRTDS